MCSPDTSILLLLTPLFFPLSRWVNENDEENT